jgi:hypothetical protein
MWRSSGPKRIVNDAAIACGVRKQGRVSPPTSQPGIAAMTYRPSFETAATPLAGIGKREFLPHLVCSWTLDPASRRLSCGWAPPADRWDFALPARIAGSRLRSAIGLAAAQA